MFKDLAMAEADPILDLTEAWSRDPNERKINLGVGEFRDDDGATPTLRCVKTAEQRLLQANVSKTYLPIPGSPEYGACIQRMLFGTSSDVIAEKRARTAHTPGGTGALRIAADFIKKSSPSARIWVSAPTWPNHHNVFRAAGIEIRAYPYYNAEDKAVDFDKMLAALAGAAAGDVVLLHGCCHNPSGVDLRGDQWERLTALCSERALLPLFDMAYQGLADGLAEDAEGFRWFVAQGREILIASSLSKTLGLYNERVGALTLVGRSSAEVERAFSQVKQGIRANYSNPPRHGGAIVMAVLDDAGLYEQWLAELAGMRARIQSIRRALVEALQRCGLKRDFSFIAGQRGMFSLTGLTPDEVRALRERYSIYVVGSGRINVCGITERNLPWLCSAIAEVVGAD